MRGGRGFRERERLWLLKMLKFWAVATVRWAPTKFQLAKGQKERFRSGSVTGFKSSPYTNIKD